MGDTNEPALFSNERQANVESTIAMIEDILIELGHVVQSCRNLSESETPSWTITKGSAETTITILEQQTQPRVRVSSLVVTIGEATDRLPLFSMLLQLNAQAIVGAAFALQSEHVLLVAERSTTDLDRSELWQLISVVRDLADEYDDKIVAQHPGTTLGGQKGTP